MSTKISSKQELRLSESRYKQLLKASARSVAEFERIGTSQKHVYEAMLNVMEDLEKAKSIIEIEKAKDEAMLASIGEGMIAVDTRGRVMMMNSMAEEMLGWKIAQLKDKRITQFRLEDERGNLIPLRKRPTTIALSTSESIRATYFFVKKDKTRFPMVITATPIKLEGKTIGLVEIIRDITHELEIDRAKSEFVSLASHQLRTPLGIIKWYLEALVDTEYYRKAPKVIRTYIDEISKSNEQVLSLVRDLLSVSRIEQEQVKNMPTIIDLSTTIADIVKQMQLIAHKKRVAISFRADEVCMPHISIDSLRLHEVVENLVGNAVEYTLPGGSVDVSLHQRDDAYLISVKDTGIGISPSDQKKLFVKFFRSAKAVAHNPEGSGLGLYVVKSYAEGWGGKVSVESAEHKGSTFTLSLPKEKSR